MVKIVAERQKLEGGFSGRKVPVLTSINAKKPRFSVGKVEIEAERSKFL